MLLVASKRGLVGVRELKDLKDLRGCGVGFFYVWTR